MNMGKINFLYDLLHASFAGFHDDYLLCIPGFPHHRIPGV